MGILSLALEEIIGDWGEGGVLLFASFLSLVLASLHDLGLGNIATSCSEGVCLYEFLGVGRGAGGLEGLLEGRVVARVQGFLVVEVLDRIVGGKGPILLGLVGK